MEQAPAAAAARPPDRATAELQAFDLGRVTASPPDAPSGAGSLDERRSGPRRPSVRPNALGRAERSLGLPSGSIPLLPIAPSALAALGARAAATPEGLLLGATRDPEIIAEEAIHWAQLQRHGAGAPGVSRVNDAAEVEARALAPWAAQGRPIPRLHARPQAAVLRFTLPTQAESRLRKLARAALQELLPPLQQGPVPAGLVLITLRALEAQAREVEDSLFAAQRVTRLLDSLCFIVSGVPLYDLVELRSFGEGQEEALRRIDVTRRVVEVMDAPLLPEEQAILDAEAAAATAEADVVSVPEEAPPEPDPALDEALRTLRAAIQAMGGATGEEEKLALARPVVDAYREAGRVAMRRAEGPTRGARSRAATQRALERYGALFHPELGRPGVWADITRAAGPEGSAARRHLEDALRSRREEEPEEREVSVGGLELPAAQAVALTELVEQVQQLQEAGLDEEERASLAERVVERYEQARMAFSTEAEGTPDQRLREAFAASTGWLLEEVLVASTQVFPAITQALARGLDWPSLYDPRLNTTFVTLHHLRDQLLRSRDSTPIVWVLRWQRATQVQEPRWVSWVYLAIQAPPGRLLVPRQGDLSRQEHNALVHAVAIGVLYEDLTQLLSTNSLGGGGSAQQRALALYDQAFSRDLLSELREINAQATDAALHLTSSVDAPIYGLERAVDELHGLLMQMWEMSTPEARRRLVPEVDAAMSRCWREAQGRGDISPAARRRVREVYLERAGVALPTSLLRASRTTPEIVRDLYARLRTPELSEDSTTERELISYVTEHGLEEGLTTGPDEAYFIAQRLRDAVRAIPSAGAGRPRLAQVDEAFRRFERLLRHVHQSDPPYTHESRTAAHAAYAQVAPALEDHLREVCAPADVALYAERRFGLNVYRGTDEQAYAEWSRPHITELRRRAQALEAAATDRLRPQRTRDQYADALIEAFERCAMRSYYAGYPRPFTEPFARERLATEYSTRYGRPFEADVSRAIYQVEVGTYRESDRVRERARLRERIEDAIGVHVPPPDPGLIPETHDQVDALIRAMRALREAAPGEHPRRCEQLVTRAHRLKRQLESLGVRETDLAEALPRLYAFRVHAVLGDAAGADFGQALYAATSRVTSDPARALLRDSGAWLLALARAPRAPVAEEADAAPPQTPHDPTLQSEAQALHVLLQRGELEALGDWYRERGAPRMDEIFATYVRDIGPLPLDRRPGLYTGKDIGARDNYRYMRGDRPVKIGLVLFRDHNLSRAIARAQRTGSAVLLERPRGLIEAYRLWVDDSYPIGQGANGRRLGRGYLSTMGYGDQHLHVHLTINPSFPVAAIVSQHGDVLIPHRSRGERTGGVQFRAEVANPYRPLDGHMQAFGVGLSGLSGDEGALLRQFGVCMQEVALNMLSASERQLRTQRLEIERWLAQARSSETSEQAQARRRDVEQARRVARRLQFAEEEARPEIGRGYPLVFQMDDLQGFLGRDDVAAHEALSRRAGEMLESLRDSRVLILRGEVDLWALPRLIRATLQALGATPGSNTYNTVMEHVEDEAIWNGIFALAKFFVQLGLAIGATLVGGPAGAAMAVAAFGWGATDAIEETQNYIQEGTLSSSFYDPVLAPLRAEDRRHWGWVAAAWAGVLMDGADAIRAVGRLGEAIQAMAGASRSVDDILMELADGDPGLAARLRGALNDGLLPMRREPPSSLRWLEEQLCEVAGANSLRLDPSLGSGVSVIYERGADGLMNIAVRYGPNADRLALLAHKAVVRDIRRFDGLAGRFRRLWAQVRALASRSGDRALRGWADAYELEKLRTVQSLYEARGAVRVEDQADLLRRIQTVEEEIVVLEGRLPRDIVGRPDRPRNTIQEPDAPRPPRSSEAPAPHPADTPRVTLAEPEDVAIAAERAALLRVARTQLLTDEQLQRAAELGLDLHLGPAAVAGAAPPARGVAMVHGEYAPARAYQALLRGLPDAPEGMLDDVYAGMRRVDQVTVAGYLDEWRDLSLLDNNLLARGLGRRSAVTQGAYDAGRRVLPSGRLATPPREFGPVIQKLLAGEPAALQRELRSLTRALQSADNLLQDRMLQLADDLQAALATPGTPNVEALLHRLDALMEDLAPRTFADNVLLREAWERALARVQDGSGAAATSATSVEAAAASIPAARARLRELDEALSASGLTEGERAALLTQRAGEQATLDAAYEASQASYARARSLFGEELTLLLHHIQQNSAAAVDVNALVPPRLLNLDFDPDIEVHHLLFRKHYPERALAPDNLILAPRGGAGVDDVHDLLHRIFSANGDNIWRDLHPRLASYLEDLQAGRRPFQQAAAGTLHASPSTSLRLQNEYGAAVVEEALRTHPHLLERPIDELAEHLRRQANRVTERTPGAYEAIDLDPDAIEGWHFRDDVSQYPDGGQRRRTRVAGPGSNAVPGVPNEGAVVRVYNPADQSLELSSAQLSDSLPSFIQSEVPVVPGRGTPTITHVTLRQMRMFGIEGGSLRAMRLSRVRNVDAICHLHVLRQTMPLDEAIVHTHAVQYTQTIITQSGHELRRASVGGAGSEQPIGDLLSQLERDAANRGATPELQDQLRAAAAARHDALLERYGLTRETVVLTDFDVELELGPLGGGG